MESVDDKVSPMRKSYLLAVLALVLSFQGTPGAQVIFLKKVGDKTVACMHTGLTSDLKNCDTHPDWYTYVFVGLISAVTPVANDEKEIQLVPEEVFLGAPANDLTVLTSQAYCLRDLKAGDRWLFYLRKVPGKPIVLDYYANDSLPVADANDQIATLRRLENIGDFGLLRGQVVRGGPISADVVANAQITAIRGSDHQAYVSITDADGHFEFQPLPPGEYKITVQPIGSYRPDDSEVRLNRGSCWDLTLSRSPHAEICGHVRSTDGVPVRAVDVVLIRSDNSGYETTRTDRDGHFTFDSEEPGKYVLGLNFPPRIDWFNGSVGGPGVRIPPASLFYPGVQDRSSARVIRLQTDEKLNNLDFILPAQ
jgi:hypothetical protein